MTTVTARIHADRSHLLRDLTAAACRACDRHGDSEEARADMRAEILALPPQLRADLLAHFDQAYPTGRAA